MSLPGGTRLGPYEILAPIGAGGMGEVYRARDTRLDRIVAIKTSKQRFSKPKLLAIAALLLTASLGAAELTVDHVSVAGRDLKQMQARLAALGIPSEFGGPHSNHATQMALTSFPDGSYLELIALQDQPDEKAVTAHYWSRQIRGNAGPTAWAVRANDVEAEVKRLRAAGIQVTPTAQRARAS